MSENIRLALKGIWSHKLRSFLTMLGVIIGIASIIAIVSTIKGTNEQIMQNLIGAGNNNVTISLRQGDSEYWMDAGLPSNVIPVTDSQIRDIRELSDVADASFYYKRKYASEIKAGVNSLSGGSLFGIDSHYLSTVGYIVYKGRPFVESDYENYHKTALLDEKAAELFYDVVKKRPFMDGNKRIGALLFVVFLTINNYHLTGNGETKISDRALTALAILVVESKPAEKDLIVALICKLLEN